MQKIPDYDGAFRGRERSVCHHVLITKSRQKFGNGIIQIDSPFFQKDQTGEEGALRTIRVVTMVICVLSLAVSMLMRNIINVMYLGGLFYSTVVFFPLVIGLFWKRATAPAALISMVCAAAVGLFSEFFLAGKAAGLLGLPSNVIAAGVSFILFVFITLLTSRRSK